MRELVKQLVEDIIEKLYEYNKNEILEEQFRRCGGRCKRCYNKNKEKINEILEDYKEYIPFLCIKNSDLRVNKYSEILNHEEFLPICLNCCRYIVNSYNFTKDVLLKRYFKIGYLREESMFYN